MATDSFDTWKGFFFWTHLPRQLPQPGLVQRLRDTCSPVAIALPACAVFVTCAVVFNYCNVTQNPSQRRTGFCIVATPCVQHKDAFVNRSFWSAATSWCANDPLIPVAMAHLQLGKARDTRSSHNGHIYMHIEDWIVMQSPMIAIYWWCRSSIVRLVDVHINRRYIYVLQSL